MEMEVFLIRIVGTNSFMQIVLHGQVRAYKKIMDGKHFVEEASLSDILSSLEK
jgi:hypothetical protein